MLKRLPFLLLLLMLVYTGIDAQSQKLSVYDQLVYVNQEWKNHPDVDPTLRTTPAKILNEQQLIQLHLQETEKMLRKRDVNDLTASQKENRSNHLDVLHRYRLAGVFPVNDQHANRQPYFIDKFNTYCAVGYLMQQSGADAMARSIHDKQNFSYLSDIHHPALMDWVEHSGLSFSELALIQPGYINDRPSTVLEMHYNNTGTDVGEYIEFQQLSGINPGMYPIDHLIFYDANGLAYKTLLVANMQTAPSFGVLYYTFSAGESFADVGKIELRASTGLLVQETVEYNAVSVIVTDYSVFSQTPHVHQYTVGESESTAVGTSLTFCGHSHGYGATFLSLQSMASTPGTVNPCTILPIELSQFTYTLNSNSTVNILWEVLAQGATNYYEIEKSTNGSDFATIGRQVANRSIGINKYSFADKKPSFINHYRLKQVDVDGKFFYSKILFVKVPQASLLTLLANAVKDVLQVQVNLQQTESSELAIYDFAGRKVLQSKVTNGMQTINVSKLGKGKYLLQLSTNGETYNSQFMKL
jgi:hypothetical protein